MMPLRPRWPLPSNATRRNRPRPPLHPRRRAPSRPWAGERLLRRGLPSSRPSPRCHLRSIRRPGARARRCPLRRPSALGRRPLRSPRAHRWGRRRSEPLPKEHRTPVLPPLEPHRSGDRRWGFPLLGRRRSAGHPWARLPPRPTHPSAARRLFHPPPRVLRRSADRHWGPRPLGPPPPRPLAAHLSGTRPRVALPSARDMPRSRRFSPLPFFPPLEEVPAEHPSAGRARRSPPPSRAPIRR